MQTNPHFQSVIEAIELAARETELLALNAYAEAASRGIGAVHLAIIASWVHELAQAGLSVESRVDALCRSGWDLEAAADRVLEDIAECVRDLSTALSDMESRAMDLEAMGPTWFAPGGRSDESVLAADNAPGVES